jgi:hypothetical protein
MNKRLALYFVAHTNDDGDNLDLFVWAVTPRACIGHWRVYYRAGDELPTIIYRVPSSSTKNGSATVARRCRRARGLAQAVALHR